MLRESGAHGMRVAERRRGGESERVRGGLYTTRRVGPEIVLGELLCWGRMTGGFSWRLATRRGTRAPAIGSISSTGAYQSMLAAISFSSPLPCIFRTPLSRTTRSTSSAIPNPPPPLYHSTKCASRVALHATIRC